VFGSVACFGARLVVTQSRQERALADLRASERGQARLVLDLEAKNAELERFTYTVSHDLRSPLITILGFLGFVERAVAAGETGRAAADLERIRAAATLMERLLRELLEVSRIGRVTAPARAVRLEALAHEVVASAQGTIAAAGVELRVEPGLPAVHGDPVRLRQALQNLVDNAVKFTAGRPDARVTIAPGGVDEAGRLLLFVRDNGIGIDPRHHERVFGLFERLDNAREGTGVGLAIVKRVVELHGGRVWVDSTPGQGATFWLALPGAPAGPATS
jgi:signal transduction histidine kinase